MAEPTANLVAQRLRELRKEGSWAKLINHDRPLLMEACCSPASILSTVMEEKAGPNSAIRISGWNGCMLGTSKGNLEARKRRAAAKPRHL